VYPRAPTIPKRLVRLAVLVPSGSSPAGLPPRSAPGMAGEGTSLFIGALATLFLASLVDSPPNRLPPIVPSSAHTRLRQYFGRAELVITGAVVAKRSGHRQSTLDGPLNL
jgi:hypothetical protein